MPQTFKVGDLVMINNPDAQRSNWPLDCISETYQGANDVV